MVLNGQSTKQGPLSNGQNMLKIGGINVHVYSVIKNLHIYICDTKCLMKNLMKIKLLLHFTANESYILNWQLTLLTYHEQS